MNQALLAVYSVDVYVLALQWSPTVHYWRTPIRERSDVNHALLTTAGHLPSRVDADLDGCYMYHNNNNKICRAPYAKLYIGNVILYLMLFLGIM